MVAPVRAERRSDHFWAGPRQDLVRRLVVRRLPPGSSVVDAAWRPGSPLASLPREYPTVAVVESGSDAPPPAVRAATVRLPFAAGSVEGVLLLDVLERLEDDVAPLVEATRVLRSGGLALAVVPAGPRLWSAHDQLAGHRRRYTSAGLARVATGAGLVPEQVHRFQCLLYPLFAANRLRARCRPEALAVERRPPRWLGQALTAVNQAEVVVSRRVPLPWGTSLLLVARKP